MSAPTRRTLIAASGALAAGAFAPAGLRGLQGPQGAKHALWTRGRAPKLRGAVFVQRRVYPDLDGPSFLGAGPVGAPVSPPALASLAGAGANLASWSGPGPFRETWPFDPDPIIEGHISGWLDACAAAGLYTTLCFRSGPGRSAFAFHPGETWYPPALYDASIWFDREKQDAWAQMTAWTLRRFGGHRALAGVLAMDEPNGADLGADDVWPHFAARIVSACAGLDQDTPLLLSPDRWARLSHAQALRQAAGPEPVIITHDYEPWRYTHPEAGVRPRFRPQETEPAPPRSLGPCGVLEFGAPGGARGQVAYLRHRISAYEAAGTNWAVFRWTSGWAQYEAIEGARALNQDPAALPVLTQAFSRNRARP